MRAKLNISLPADLERWVQRQTDQGGYETASAYIHQLLREEQQRQVRLGVETKLQEAFDSGAPAAVTGATWRQSQRRVDQRLKDVAKERRDNGTNR
ncbi:MAG TPA: hypothetical protein VK395_07275 [Gemmataceae bacterium]|nr:hypothetical protein [Gemmataceae bacterium]